MTEKTQRPLRSLSRRRFVQGLAAGGVLSGLPSITNALRPRESTTHGTASDLYGPEIDLVIGQSPVNFTGVRRMATTINGSLPAPTLRLREGDQVTIRVTNNLDVDTSLHWHGIILPYQMDGIPGISFKGIAPGETFTYQFTLQQSGTYWYHAHSGFQEMTGIYGALIIEPKDGEHIESERDYIVQFSDWTDDDPMRVFSKLRVQSDVYNLSRPSFGDFAQDISDIGFIAAMDKRKMWNEMRMKPTDLADLSSRTLTYLTNGTTPAGNWTAIFKPGERVRLRFINAASNTFYDVRIPGVTLTVVQCDGQDIVPVAVDEFRFGPGETYDVIVQPSQEAHTIFAQTMDRSGFALATLAIRDGLRAAVPSMDPVQWLTMEDMMGAMDHEQADHSAENHALTAQPIVDHSAHIAPAADHSAHVAPAQDHSAHGTPALDHSAHSASVADHSAHTAPATDEHAMHGSDSVLSKPSQSVRHASTEYGPSVDMRVDTPRTNLDNPGIGLRDNSRRVLTLADLRSAKGVLNDTRPPVREIELHLTGNMERYTWSIDGLEFGQSTPVTLHHHERVRVILQNDTMMTHPMHLHGMWSDLENDQGELLVRRHTIPVQPAQRISFLTTPHDLGRWAWHCHLLLHMDSGMFREVVVA